MEVSNGRVRYVQDIGRLPCAKTSRECAMQPLPPALVGHFLLPYWHIAAIVSCLGIVGWQGRSIQRERGVFRRTVGFECGSGALGGHVLVSAAD